MGSSFWADFRQSLRALRRNPTYSGAVVLTLALAIGATTALFTVVHEAILKPLPYENPSQLISISSAAAQEDREVTYHPWFARWEGATRSFDAIAAYMPERVSLAGRGEPVILRGASVSREYFAAFGTTPLRGRFFGANDYAVPAGTGPVVLSHGLWRDRFGSDSSVVGTSVLLEGKPRTIVGIARDGFVDPFRSVYWEPAEILAPESSAFQFSVRYTWVVGRLREGLTVDVARSELTALAQQHEQTVPAVHRDTTSRVVLMPLHERLYGSAKRPLVILSCGIGLLLLVACANIANLGLARAASRQQEFVTRTALGASRWRLARIALIECLVLSLTGALIGLAIPLWTLPAVLRYKPDSLANVTTLSMDGTVIGFTALAAVVVAIVFGVFPAVAAARTGVVFSAHTRGRVAGGRAFRRVRHVLIVAEVATAVTLVTGAGLLVRSLANVLSVDTGIRGLNTLTASISLPESRYASATEQRAFFDQLSARVAALPGVEAVSYSTWIAPLRGFRPNYTSTNSAGRRISMSYATVAERYPQAAGLILRSGRAFVPGDRASAERAVLLSETAARMLFPDRDPIGQPVEASFDNEFGPGGLPFHPRGLVIGVVQDVAQGNFETAPVGLAYRLIDHTKSGPATLLVRTASDPSPIIPAIRSIVSSIDPLQPVSAISTLDKDLEMATAPRRFGVLVTGAFALLALALSVTGLYGVMVFQLAQRRRELGIRLALGARGAQLQTFVFRESMGLACLGTAIGVALSLGLTRLLRGYVFGVGVTDPVTLAVAPFALLVAATFVSYWPARRAGRVNPIEALRHE